jgi:hypothetical protein
MIQRHRALFPARNASTSSYSSVSDPWSNLISMPSDLAWAQVLAKISSGTLKDKPRNIVAGDRVMDIAASAGRFDHDNERITTRIRDLKAKSAVNPHKNHKWQ